MLKFLPYSKMPVEERKQNKFARVAVFVIAPTSLTRANNSNANTVAIVFQLPLAHSFNLPN